VTSTTCYRQKPQDKGQHFPNVGSDPGRQVWPMAYSTSSSWIPAPQDHLFYIGGLLEASDLSSLHVSASVFRVSIPHLTPQDQTWSGVRTSEKQQTNKPHLRRVATGTVQAQGCFHSKAHDTPLVDMQD
jgi:hypothetical protein